MKTLLIMRHASAMSQSHSTHDFDRALSEHGIAEVKRVATLLKEKEIKIGTIYCSPALRAKQTLEVLLKDIHLSPKTEFKGSIYDATTAELMRLLREDRAANTIMIVGHNPGLTDLVQRLTHTYQSLSTSNIACVTFHTDQWSDIVEGSGKLAWLLLP